MGVNFEKTHGEIPQDTIAEKSVESIPVPAQETIQSFPEDFEALHAHLDVETNLIETQPKILADKGVALGLSPEDTAQTLAENNYHAQHQTLLNRARKLSEALIVSTALGAPGVVQASNLEVPPEQSTVVRAEAPIGVSDGLQEQVMTSETTEGIGIQENTIQPEDGVSNEEEIAQPEDGVPNAEEISQPEGEIREAKIIEVASDQRFQLYQELITVVVNQGATSPESMKKLIEIVDKDKTVMADTVATYTVPYYGSMKRLLEGMKGSTFEDKKLSGFDRLKYFSKGVVGLAMDASQLGTLGKVLSSLKHGASLADGVERTTGLVSLLKEIENNPNDTELPKRIQQFIDNQTIAEGVQKTAEDSMRGIYDEIDKSTPLKPQIAVSISE